MKIDNSISEFSDRDNFFKNLISSSIKFNFLSIGILSFDKLIKFDDKPIKRLKIEISVITIIISNKEKPVKGIFLFFG